MAGTGDKNGNGARQATNGTISWRRSFYIALGWAVIALGVIIGPLPGPLGVPVMVLGAIILLRNSSDFRRIFVRIKRRYPMMTWPLRTALDRLRTRFRQRRSERAAAKARARAQLTARVPS